MQYHRCGNRLKLLYKACPVINPGITGFFNMPFLLKINNYNSQIFIINYKIISYFLYVLQSFFIKKSVEQWKTMQSSGIFVFLKRNYPLIFLFYCTIMNMSFIAKNICKEEQEGRII